MNYLNLDEIKSLLGSLKRIDHENYDYDQFEHLKINNFIVSLWAGKHSFSYPRQRLESILNYELVHLNILSCNELGVTAMLCPKKDYRLCYFDWINYFSSNIINSNNPSYIGSNVPISTVCQIVKDLYKVSLLKTFF